MTGGPGTLVLHTGHTLLCSGTWWGGECVYVTVAVRLKGWPRPFSQAPGVLAHCLFGHWPGGPGVAPGAWEVV